MSKSRHVRPASERLGSRLLEAYADLVAADLLTITGESPKADVTAAREKIGGIISELLDDRLGEDA